MFPFANIVLITAAFSAWGTRITAAGESRASPGLYGSAATTASGALLQSRKRAYAEPVRSAPATGAATPPAGTTTPRSPDITTTGPGYPQAGVQGEPHRAHVPIPAA